MEIEKAIKIMKIEQECVRRQGTNLCKRDECVRRQDTADVLEAYETAIDCCTFANRIISNIVECMTGLGCKTIEEFQEHLKGGEQT